MKSFLSIASICIFLHFSYCSLAQCNDTVLLTQGPQGTVGPAANCNGNTGGDPTSSTYNFSVPNTACYENIRVEVVVQRLSGRLDGGNPNRRDFFTINVNGNVQTVEGTSLNNPGPSTQTVITNLANPLNVNISVTATVAGNGNPGNGGGCTERVQVASVNVFGTDTSPPIFDSAPGAIADILCNDPLPTQETLTATDTGCSTATTVVPSVDPFTVDNCNGYDITYRWSTSDACGNAAADETVTFRVLPDTTPPVVPTAPAAENYQCISEVPAPGDLSASDNCSDNITATGVDSDNGGTGCTASPLIITRTWTFTDDCGNSDQVQQTITVIDDTPPVVPTAPAAENYQCISEVPAPGDLSASDNCSGNITATGVDSDNGGTGCTASPLIITRTWTFTDDCGNSDQVQQTITVIDDTPPVLPTPPAAENYQCISEVPAPGDLSASDNCSDNITATGVDSDNGGTGCTASPLIITRTWTFTDDCGNSDQVQQTITVIDDTPPVLPTPPAAENYQCISEVPAPGDLSASDNCSGNITATGVDSDNGGTGCTASPLIITRTWTFADDCGNSDQVQQTITVIDDTPPVLPTPPAAENYQCISEVPAPGDLSASDNCSGNITATGVDSDNGGTGCTASPLIITRTWTFTDDCGNSDQVQQTITVIDDTPPVLPTPPAAENYQCISEVPAPGDLSASDNCSDNITATGVDSDNGGTGCTASPLIITRTWTFTDDCGNSDQVQQTITVIDDTPPVLPTPPAAENYQCISEVPAPGDLSASDNCSGNITATGVDSDNGGTGCTASPLIITRTWTFTDDCGNSDQVQQTITVIDDTPPVVPTAPAAENYQCISEVPAPGDLSASDNCSGNITATGVDSDNGGTGCTASPLIITRTWTFTDDCGNSDQVQQTITVIDDTPPVLPTPPAAENYQCISEVPAPGDLSASDNCSDNITATGVDSDNGGTGCTASPLIITRTWTFTDDCGNSDQVQQTITVIDDTPPVLPTPPAAENYQCISEVPAPGDLSASDNCSGNITATGVDSDNGGTGCTASPLIITRTWTFTDDCGNSDQVQQTITVIDDTPPVLPTPPAAENYQCISEVPAPGDLSASDNCSGNITATGVDSDNGGTGCTASPLIITRTWTFTDDCGNSDQVQQTITVVDDTVPTIDPAPGDIFVNCLDNIPVAVDLNYTDNCSPGGTAIFTEDQFTQDNCRGYTIVRRWNAMDECGNPAIERTQTITVNPCPQPQIDDVVYDTTCASGDVTVVASNGFNNNYSYTLVDTDAPVTTGVPQASPVFDLSSASFGTFTVTDIDTGCTSQEFTQNFGCNLPVELVSFTGTDSEKCVNLEWVTASEENNDFFAVERSLDGRNFEVVATVNGAGTTSEKLNYSYCDVNDLCGKVYYRLKQTDFDGQFSYSDIIIVKRICSEDVFRVFPNPFNKRLSLEISSNKVELVTIELVDAIGRIHISNEESLAVGVNRFVYDWELLPNDIYFLLVRYDSGKICTLKTIKMK